MGAVIEIFKFLWENKLMAMVPGWAALVLIGYHQVFQAAPFETDLNELVIKGVQQELDRYYTALCMNPGDQSLLAIIREKQSEHVMRAGERYDPPPCDLLLKIR